MAFDVVEFHQFTGNFWPKCQKTRSNFNVLTKLSSFAAKVTFNWDFSIKRVRIKSPAIVPILGRIKWRAERIDYNLCVHINALQKETFRLGQSNRIMPIKMESNTKQFRIFDMKIDWEMNFRKLKIGKAYIAHIALSAPNQTNSRISIIHTPLCGLPVCTFVCEYVCVCMWLDPYFLLMCTVVFKQIFHRMYSIPT